MPNPTPGQICYEAYQAAYDCFIWTLPWTQLQPHFRHVWDAAAQAVLAPRLTDQAEKMHHLLAYLLDHATAEDVDALHGWLTEQTARLHQIERR
jgi:hypothetical protein